MQRAVQKAAGVLLFLFFLTACGTFVQSSTSTAQSQAAPFSVLTKDETQLSMLLYTNQMEFVAPDGFYRVDTPLSQAYSNLMYYDFNTLQQKYVCEVPGCSHSTERCKSFLGSWAAVRTFVWNNKLYLLYSGFLEDASQMLRPQLDKLEQRNLDGTDAKVLLEDESYGLYSTSVAARGDTLYLFTQKDGLVALDAVTGHSALLPEAAFLGTPLAVCRDALLYCTVEESGEYKVYRFVPETRQAELVYAFDSAHTTWPFASPSGNLYGFYIDTGELWELNPACGEMRTVSQAFVPYRKDRGEGQNTYSTLQTWHLSQVGDWLLVDGFFQKPYQRMAYHLITGELREVVLNQYSMGYIYPVDVWGVTPRGLLVTEDVRTRVLSNANDIGSPYSYQTTYPVYALIELEEFLNSKPSYRAILPVKYAGSV